MDRVSRGEGGAMKGKLDVLKIEVEFFSSWRCIYRHSGVSSVESIATGIPVIPIASEIVELYRSR
jgi:hypothetical protein